MSVLSAPFTPSDVEGHCRAQPRLLAALEDTSRLRSARTESFGASAARLAGLAGALLGWRPGEFWGSTPEELWVILEALRPPRDGVTRDEIARLQEMFPDG